jgi:hypothetical protein
MAPSVVLALAHEQVPRMCGPVLRGGYGKNSQDGAADRKERSVLLFFFLVDVNQARKRCRRSFRIGTQIQGSNPH